MAIIAKRICVIGRLFFVEDAESANADLCDLNRKYCKYRPPMTLAGIAKRSRAIPDIQTNLMVLMKSSGALTDEWYPESPVMFVVVREGDIDTFITNLEKEPHIVSVSKNVINE